MITQRRVFRAKPGASVAVVNKLKEFKPILERVGGPARRIYTDLLSGETDRVVWEFDVENLTALENMTKSATQDAEFRAAYEQWYAGLQPLILGATVELWNRENQTYL